jgi:NTP pyrophosphatase (non-canonical NTP hydrolase)
MEIRELQARLRAAYEARDRARGRDATFMWLVEEVGELSRALRSGDRENVRHELSDALAWLVSVATLEGVDMEEAAARYAGGCPRCGKAPCSCPAGRPAGRRRGARRRKRP